MVSAYFIGWQENPKGDPIPLFNISGGLRDKSTVSLATLKRWGFKIPKYPHPKATRFPSTGQARQQ